MSVEEITETNSENQQQQQQPEMPEFFLIPGPVAQATMNYLAQRPYVEVAGLIQAFSNLQPVSQPQNRTAKRAVAKRRKR